MGHNPNALFLVRTAHVNCRKQSSSWTGFCDYILETAVLQNRQRLLLKLRSDPANGLPLLIAKFFDPYFRCICCVEL